MIRLSRVAKLRSGQNLHSDAWVPKCVLLLVRFKIEINMRKTYTFLFLFFLVGGSLFLYIQNGRLAFRPKKKLFTQLTDNEAFRHFCRGAVANPAIFESFKRDPVYTLFYENVSAEQGKELYGYLKTHASHLFQEDLIEKFRGEDRLGSPITYFYDEIGSFSPSTLRAIKVAHDIETHHGSLEGFKVIEIGAGHGSQCKILTDLFPGIEYTIVDLPEALELAKKTLGALGVKGIRFLTPDQLQNESCDLVLSNYTFTESGASLQERYFKQIIRQAKRGYLTCNFFPKHFRVRPMKKEQLLKKFMTLALELEFLPEFPQTGTGNFLLIWK